MKSQVVLLGIEAGGSKGRVALSCGGRITARTIFTGLNPVDVGPNLFERRLAHLVTPLLRQPETQARWVYACAAIAGAGRSSVREECKQALKRLLAPLGARHRIKVMTDADALAEAFLKKSDGIVLIAGTGSICVGVTRCGRKVTRARAGGKGSYLDDGSGSKLGLAVLQSALRALDGTQEAEPMVDLLCTRLGMGLSDVAAVYLKPKRSEVAELARIALEAYALGDPLARALVSQAVRDLMNMVLAVKRQIHLNDNIMVVTAGGLFQNQPFRRRFRRLIGGHLPNASIIEVEDSLIHLLESAKHLSSGS